MANNINPQVDIAFKKLFGVEENKDLLISLINSVTSEADQVSEITLLNPYNPKNFREDKLSILDIKAVGKDGKLFNIEVQITDEADYDKRALYYWAKLYSEQLKSGKDYSTLNKAIGIHFLCFTSIPQTAKYHNVFHICEKDSGVTYFKDLELHTIELTKFSDEKEKELSELVAKVKTTLDMWLAFLARSDLLDVEKLPKKLNNKKLKKAIEVLSVMNFTEEERNAYEEHLKWLRIEANTLKKAHDDGIKEGMAEGQQREKRSIAQELLKQGISITVVSAATGLSEENLKILLH